MVQINEQDIGTAGEYLTCADLITKGYRAFMSASGLHYDVVVDYKGKLVRIQVKTTQGPMKKRTPGSSTSYIYNVRAIGKNGRKEYTAEMTDIFAFVALDIKKIAYVKFEDVRQTMVFRETSLMNKTDRMRFYQDYTIEKAMGEPE